MFKKRILVLSAAAMLLTACGTEIRPMTETGSAEVSEAEQDASAVTEASLSEPDSIDETVSQDEEGYAPEIKLGKTLEALTSPTGESIYLSTYDEVTAGKHMTVKDLVEDTNGVLMEPDRVIDTDGLGYHQQEILLRDGGTVLSQVVEYTVADRTPPVFLINPNGYMIQRGEGFDPYSALSFGDDFDPYPSIYIDGTVDTSEVGDYTVTATLEDSSGNTASRTFTLYVSDNADNTVYDNNTRIDFQDLMSQEGGPGRSLGIDVSYWQGNIDFNAVKNAGCEFVIIRMGYCRGGIVEDDNFSRNLQNAKAAGLKVGVYFYSSDNSREEVVEHAKWMIDRLGGEELDLPVAFDWEDFESFRSYGMSFSQLNGLYQAFSDTLGEAGYDTMVYSSRNFLEDVWDTDGRTVWLAHYVDETDHEGPYTFWQRCAWGRISGISGDVDLDVWITE